MDPEGLWKIVEEKHQVHSACEVKAIIKLAVRMNLQSIRQGGYKSITSHKQWYTNALQAYHDQKNPNNLDQDQVMDFFHGLDKGRFADFKVNFLNGLQVKSITEPPKDLNAMFMLVNNWLKPKVLTGW